MNMYRCTCYFKHNILYFIAINKNEEKIPNTNGEVNEREIVNEESVDAEKVGNSGKSENVENTENAANLETAVNRRREVAAANAAALLYDIALELNADIYNIKYELFLLLLILYIDKE